MRTTLCSPVPRIPQPQKAGDRPAAGTHKESNTMWNSRQISHSASAFPSSNGCTFLRPSPDPRLLRSQVAECLGRINLSTWRPPRILGVGYQKRRGCT